MISRKGSQQLGCTGGPGAASAEGAIDGSTPADPRGAPAGFESLRVSKSPVPPPSDPGGAPAAFAPDVSRDANRAYHATVPRSTPNAWAIRRWDHPRCNNTSIVCTQPTLSRFAIPRLPSGPSRRGRSTVGDQLLKVAGVGGAPRWLLFGAPLPLSTVWEGGGA